VLDADGQPVLVLGADGNPIRRYDTRHLFIHEAAGYFAH
jgi:hypothetical protein